MIAILMQGALQQVCYKLEIEGDNDMGESDMAERTGLEPATPGVTGRYSNQLNYRSAAVYIKSTSN